MVASSSSTRLQAARMSPVASSRRCPAGGEDAESNIFLTQVLSSVMSLRETQQATVLPVE